MKHRLARLLLVPAVFGLVPACGRHGGTTVHVFAAASLQQSFDTLARSFEHAHPAVHLDLNYGGSSTLAQQILAGADADVFASADQRTMALVNSHFDGTPEVFATNTLEIAVRRGNPRHIARLADLRSAQTAVCAAPVPCGAATRQLERASGVHLDPTTEEDNVTAVITQVSTGQVDAGIVYVTDVRAQAKHITGVPVPQARRIVNRYPIVPLRGSKHRGQAAGFTDFIRSAAAQAVLRKAGFGAP
ncbi:MAG: molybdate ABC transporter substrate-binding protein [Mycobacteriales bacterium]